MFWMRRVADGAILTVCAFRWGNRFGLESYPLNVFVFIQICLRNALAMPLSDETPLDVRLPNMGL